MPEKTYSYDCRRCHRSYHSYNSDKYYCSSSCQSRDKYEALYPSKKNCKKSYIFKENIEKTITINQIDIDNKKWLDKKPKAARARQDLKDILYADTFAKHIPKKLKVIRG